MEQPIQPDSLRRMRRQALAVDIFVDGDLIDVASNAAGRWAALRSRDIGDYGAKLQQLRRTKAGLVLTDLNERAIETAARHLVAAVRQGQAAVETGKLISEATGLTNPLAKLVAVDGTLFVNAAITRARQEATGVRQYVWRAIHDGREDQTHVAREGCIYEWSNVEPPGGHPGEDVGCRCSAEPVLLTWEQLEQQNPAGQLPARGGAVKEILSGFLSGLFGKR